MTGNRKKLRIAFIVRYFPSLTETFILNQIVNLLAQGHDIRIFARQTASQAVIHEAVNRFRLLDRTHYASEIPHHKWQRRIKTVGLIIFYAGIHPIDLFRLLKAGLTGPDRFDYEAFYYGLRFLGKRYDILHAHFGYSGKIAVLMKKINIAPRIMTTFHGSDVNRYPRIHGEKVYENLFKNGDVFTVNTEFTGERLRKLGCAADKIHILPVGLETRAIVFRERRFPEDGQVKILTVGRLVEKKGHCYMIRALPEVIKKFPLVKYLIVGEGELAGSLRELVRQLEIKEHVQFLGPQAADRIREIYNQVHLFVLPSVTAADGDMEGQGLVLQEAQAAGLPVVSTLHNGIPEGVLDGKSAILVPEKDSQALAKAFLYLMDHVPEWGKMGRQGHEYVTDRYDIRKLNRQLEDLYYGLSDNKI